MRRCAYCMNALELVPVRVQVKACVQCGCLYTQELLDSVSDEYWEEVLTSPRYEVQRFPGNPPTVVVTELSPA